VHGLDSGDLHSCSAWLSLVEAFLVHPANLSSSGVLHDKILVSYAYRNNDRKVSGRAVHCRALEHKLDRGDQAPDGSNGADDATVSCTTDMAESQGVKESQARLFGEDSRFPFSHPVRLISFAWPSMFSDPMTLLVTALKREIVDQPCKIDSSFLPTVVARGQEYDLG
jgi:hypothetical protein